MLYKATVWSSLSRSRISSSFLTNPRGLRIPSRSPTTSCLVQESLTPYSRITYILKYFSGILRQALKTIRARQLLNKASSFIKEKTVLSCCGRLCLLNTPFGNFIYPHTSWLMSKDTIASVYLRFPLSSVTEEPYQWWTPFKNARLQ